MLKIRTIARPAGSAIAAALVGIILAACSGGQSGPATLASSCDPANPATGNECGTVLVALTDAEGDFTSYTVEVLAISLERADGSMVETLPAATAVDFAALTDLADLVSAATLAPADIVGGRIRIDYTNAGIYVESNGAIVPATAVDASGAPLGIVDVEIRLDDRERLVVTRGRTQLLQIDFDLAASHTVDTTTEPATATAEPILIAEVRPVERKALRVRGALVDVDTDNGTYDVRIRPWHSRVGDHGIITVATRPATEFEIDGEIFVGPAGLDALAALPEGTLTVAFGLLDVSDRSFTASVVHAGDSLGGDRLSSIHGNIVARSGDRLLVKGAIAVPRARRARYHRAVVIEVGPATGVARQGDGAVALDHGALSVGQRIVALGTLIDPADGADDEVALDATAGRVRMLPTHVAGSVNSIATGQVDMTLRTIDGLGVGLFDFSGTGALPATDADPAHYEVATDTLALTAAEPGRPIRIVGFVGGFGAAPPDFQGRTLIGPRDLRAVLGVGWGADGAAAPFRAMTADSLVIDLANPAIGERHHMRLGSEVIDLFDLPSSPSIRPSAERGIYAITEPGHIELFSRFPAFVDELAIRLGGGAAARSLAASGSYSNSDNALESRRIVVRLLAAD